jgi:hypothetical protein
MIDSLFKLARTQDRKVCKKEHRENFYSIITIIFQTERGLIKFFFCLFAFKFYAVD